MRDSVHVDDDTFVTETSKLVVKRKTHSHFSATRNHLSCYSFPAAHKSCVPVFLDEMAIVKYIAGRKAQRA